MTKAFRLVAFTAIAAQAFAANPPPGIEIPADIERSLRTEIDKLSQAIESFDANTAPRYKRYLPDVIIYRNAALYALELNQFYKNEAPNEFEIALAQMETGIRRFEALVRGEAPWTRQTGLVARGYRSKIDGSIQPYGLEIPDTYDFDNPSP